MREASSSSWGFKYPSLPQNSVTAWKQKLLVCLDLVYLPAQSQYKYYSSSKHLAWNTNLSLLNHLILHLLKPLLEIYNILGSLSTYHQDKDAAMVSTASQACCGHKPQAVLEPQRLQARWMSYPRMPRASPWQQAMPDVMSRLLGEKGLFSPEPNHGPGRWHGQPEHLPEVQAWIMHPEGKGLRVTKTLYSAPQLQKPNFPNSNSFLLSG